MEYRFTAYSPFVKTLKTDRGYRLELELSPQDITALIELNQETGSLFEVTMTKIPNS